MVESAIIQLIGCAVPSPPHLVQTVADHAINGWMIALYQRLCAAVMTADAWNAQEILVMSTPLLDPSLSRDSAIILQSAKVRVAEKDSKSSAYENRTKSTQSGGLETNSARDRISDCGRSAAVRRFLHEARGYWRFQRAKIRQRKLIV
jgi:hypothetical protein